ncbi:uncharacterized protein NECHADRAFT_85055 [Fusarium vanettenii 77-13-4]|uniref:Amino acid permease/ SLC12A domain-containing protein n=1 Tax=Fusarium vanettenii (strain ATCC MYA-4622 / CBS 123669 / FGSC 9596 / NRRL 45880 / 77-13-4) TaxID=660122 RepID=C7YUV6_FUSV7|nr:uncharacterized protein NECHADRAFT_85055 [Fusarium vanettenii 77-13-4]EEU44873.1 hypothetical protein NECHADRAFT_85055 [Fusarium vanettenii 77-13-4]
MTNNFQDTMGWNCPGDDQTCHCGKFDMVLKCANDLPNELDGHSWLAMPGGCLSRRQLGGQIRGAAIAAYSLATIFVVANNKWPLWASNFIGALKLLTLVLISITGLVVLSGNVNSVLNPTANFHNVFEDITPKGNDLGSATVSIVFSSAVYSNAFNVVNEIKNPIPTLNKNTSMALLVVIIFYIFYSIAYFAVVPKGEFKEASEISVSIFFTKLFDEGRTGSNVPISWSC